MSHLMSKINWPIFILDSGELITNGVMSPKFCTNTAQALSWLLYFGSTQDFTILFQSRNHTDYSQLAVCRLNVTVATSDLQLSFPNQPYVDGFYLWSKNPYFLGCLIVEVNKSHTNTHFW
jgi:hypothetical protein